MKVDWLNSKFEQKLIPEKEKKIDSQETARVMIFKSLGFTLKHNGFVVSVILEKRI